MLITLATVAVQLGWQQQQQQDLLHHWLRLPIIRLPLL
jgi:hypothetical protein